MSAPKTIRSNSLPVGEFLRRQIRYKVPSYQRDFSWTKEQIDTLWNDFKDALQDSDRDYFIGAIVAAHTEDEDIREIVDGQQRLAALSMIYSAIAYVWKDRDDDERATGVSNDYLGNKDRRSGHIIPRLTLNENNERIFQTVVLERATLGSKEERTQSETNRLIISAFRDLKTYVQEWLREFKDPKEALLYLEEFISKRVKLIEIEVGDDADAYVIFETLNDRGLELAVSDLVKNYLFSKASSHIAKFKKSWIEISTLVGSENITPFLRHLWLSTNGLVRERELYREIRDGIKTPARAKEYIDSIQNAATFYAALSSPDSPYWSSYPPETRQHLETLIKFKVTQFKPVALAALETLDEKTFAKVLRQLVIISFRYTVVSAMSTGNLETFYSEAALKIRNKKSTSVKAISEDLRRAYVEDTRFLTDFAQKPFSKARIARYILAELESYIAKDPERIVAERFGQVNLEHILPKNPSREWKGSYRDTRELEQNVDLVGNLTLIETGKNKIVGNQSFSKKRDCVFKSSNLALNKRLEKQDTWNIQEIQKRSKELAMIAKSVWRIDFSDK